MPFVTFTQRGVFKPQPQRLGPNLGKRVKLENLKVWELWAEGVLDLIMLPGQLTTPSQWISLILRLPNFTGEHSVHLPSGYQPPLLSPLPSPSAIGFYLF